MTVATSKPKTPAFCDGIQHFADTLPDFDAYGHTPAIAPDATAIPAADEPAAVYQTLLAADALRYLTLQVTASKQSGHPGGFASIADGIAALVMLGHKNLITEVGHHAPGFYSTVFMDRSLEPWTLRPCRTCAIASAKPMVCWDTCRAKFPAC
jgi:phosphoketolase